MFAMLDFFRAQDESGDPLVFARNAEAEKGFIALLIQAVGEQHW